MESIGQGPLSGLLVADFSRILAGPAVPSVRNPIAFSATPATYRLPPPGLDEHGAEIRKWLGEPR